jgi:hypothetical protein
MVVTMLPMMSLSAARLSGGAVPTIPAGKKDDAVWVSNGFGSATAGNLAAIRNLQLLYRDYPVGSSAATYVASIRVTGLGADDGGRLVADRDYTSNVASAAAIITGTVVGDIIAYDTATDATSDAIMEAVLVKGPSGDRAFLGVTMWPGTTTPTSEFGVSLPINFVSYDDKDVVLNFSWQGNMGLPSSVTIANRHSDNFTFSIDGDPVNFNGRTRIPPIQIREPTSLGFNEAEYTVRMTLDRGFVWNNDEFFVKADVGGTLGLRLDPTAGSAPHSLGVPSRVLTGQIDAVNREPGRRLSVDIDITNAGDLTRLRDMLVFGDGNMDIPNSENNGHLWISAADNARYGPVRVHVELLTATRGTDGSRNTWTNIDVVSDATITIGEYSDAQVLFYRDEDEDLQDYIRVSGAMEWEQYDFTANSPRTEAVRAGSAVEAYHETAWVVLTESVAGVLPFTGLRDITFEFPRGAQVLGVKWETNDASFVAGQNDTDGEAWYTDGRTRDANDTMDALISRNQVQLRPEIGRERSREDVAEIRLQFYVSIEPEYYKNYGEELWVWARGPGFDDGVRAQVAIIRDPITVQTTRANIGSGDTVAAGMFRNISIEPIYVHETDIGSLEWDRTVQIFVEENTTASVTANAININALTVETDGDSGLMVGAPSNAGRSVSVPITRTSNDKPGWIRFSEIQITGLVIPGQDYRITVVGSGPANNYSYGVPSHGLWDNEPYLSPAFGFDGTDVIARPDPLPPQPPTGPGTGQPGGPGGPGSSVSQPQVLSQSGAFRLSNGDTVQPTFIMVNYGNQGFASAFVAPTVVGDILGWTHSWNEVTRQGTFTRPDGTQVVFTNGSNVVNDNGTTRYMVNADGTPANARIHTNGRFMVHIAFFRELGVSVEWMGGTAGNNTIVVTP